MASERETTTFEISGLGSFNEEELLSKDIRIVSRKKNLVQLIYNHKSYEAVIKNFDPQTKQAWINLAGFDFRIKINEPLDKLINDLGFLQAVKHSVKEIKSPMPGLVVTIYVDEGQSVAEGEKLLSLEAMKMENILKSPGEGVIKTIRVEKGQTVDKNQILIDFE
ncbi:MAG: acetyl-CoA carboxylase biotin carboxyl carrier protein subunit [Saprospiraceae bacterium]